MLTVANGLTSVPSPLKSIPSTMAFGCATPPTMFHPCVANRYEPHRVYTPQGGNRVPPRVCARAVPGVLNVIVAATKPTNAHAKSEEAIMFVTNFVFMIVFLSNFLFGFWPSLASHRGRSFPAVHRRTERKAARGYGEMSELRQTKGNKEREVSVWFRRSKESLCFLCCLLLAEKYHRARNRQHTRAGASPQTEKQSAATQ